MKLMSLSLPIPDHSHLSRRAAGLDVVIPRRESEEFFMARCATREG
jgi:hypothetical protein